ncbi:alkyl hydroperoxide reductase/ Thiol specific antioxidant/ Mal allergen [Caldalkalibacillus thermarum TA2.A1]|uniref:Alkyl hydroperoxide reductase/ Thiol specific antioxidant/ Mal allergen n=1 Tax=Caldalkalibacillus thermarum (strain TA2.A1) TaxID=986075 RepID=F5L7F7_CALTT|nr:TlpA disulfide reductase family protein [Caldalkalibacillus thermarum]EGL82749.1 alkyl hydroperoxide reductase/ Thiol specific antioxidant/ Mal allergen [Caldalkalibacillus thermarum TA2.A1]QZT32553.1 TlpA family protein disulfide reductase [Caldalkalibacillus thermarum TA2.A1]GGK20065.1 thiol:disulfide interchange protein tlpA [Caldalkalibacillus thermarum]
MKKVIVSVILLLVLGWTVFDTLSDSQHQDSGQGRKEGSLDELVVAIDQEEQPVRETEGESVGLGKGEVAPDFELVTLSGEKIALSDLRGKKVILNIWASWCPPCRAEMPDMQKFYERYQEEVEILAVNLTESEASLENVEQFVEKYELTFPVLLDEKSEVAAMYQAFTIPTSYFIDSKGIIQQKIVGPMSYDWMKEAANAME